METMSAADFFKRSVDEQKAAAARSQELAQEIEAAYARWEALTQKAEECAK